MVTVEMQIHRKEGGWRPSTYRQTPELLYSPPRIMTLIKVYQHFEFSGVLLPFLASIFKKIMLDALNDDYDDNHIITKRAQKEQHLSSTYHGQVIVLSAFQYQCCTKG